MEYSDALRIYLFITRPLMAAAGAIAAAHSWVSAPSHPKFSSVSVDSPKIGGVRGWVKQLAFDNVQYSAPVVTLRNLFERAWL
jgi:hypothetical protein